MPVAYKQDDATCPRCGGTDEIVAFDKDEATAIKRCFTHKDADCQAEWTEWLPY